MDTFESLRTAALGGSRAEGLPPGDPSDPHIGPAEIVQRLRTWDARYGVHVVDLAPPALTLRFDRLPPNLSVFCDELVAFCPNAVLVQFEDPEDFEADFSETQVLRLWWD